MSNTNLSSLRYELHEMIDLVGDESILHAIRLLLRREADFWLTISSAERQAVETGLAQLEKGEYVEHNTVKKIYEKWL
ncbi:MAG: hypothetical protein MUE81_06060 [Thermoflexibacter sp.]|jgi:predicted transcriptional regulator|nr:hypothetical protein [Thermoflexibacter sp.]